MKLDVVSMGLVCADVTVRPVDAFPPRGRISLVPSLELHLGGLAGVTATVLAQLGAKAAFTGKIGADGFGDHILGVMERNGVRVDTVIRSAGEGTSASVVLISEDGERTFLHHRGVTESLSEEDIDFDLIAQARVLHWGGPSLTVALDGEPIGRIMAKAQDMGVTTSMDTCFDGSETWFPLIEHALPHLDIVMSSIDEAQRYTGKDTPEEIADFYMSFGPSTVLIKLGENGAYVKNRESAFRLPPHRVDVVDTTGAGDAACGGFLYAYLQGWDLERCGKMANAVGALTVQHIGGAEAIESLEQVLAQMNCTD